MNTVRLIFFLVIASSGIWGCTQEKSYPPTEQATFRVIRVPVIQGKFTAVGQLILDSDIASELEELQLNVSTEVALEGLRVVEMTDEGEVAVFEANSVKGKVKILIESKESQRQRLFYIQLKPAVDAPLLGTFELSVDYVKWNDEKYVPSQPQTETTLRIAKALRQHGEDGVHTYRIPGLVTTKKGTLLAVYDVRWISSRDLQGDIDVGLSRSTDGGNTWEPMKTIMDLDEWGSLPQDQNGVGDPAILVDDVTGTIWVAALWMHGKPGVAAWVSSQPGLSPQETGQLLLVKSEDDGLTWSNPINVTESIKDPSWHLFLDGPGMGITMRDGTLVFAAQYKDANEVPHSTIIYSTDRGETWSVGKGARSATTEAQVVELSDGSLMLNMRDDRGGSRAVMVTRDMGETWEEHISHRSALIEPICMASIIANSYSESPVLFFSNPDATDERYNITIKTSFDEGETWPIQNQVFLDEEEGAGYSCLTMIDRDHLGILYESSQADLVFQKIPVKELIP